MWLTDPQSYGKSIRRYDWQALSLKSASVVGVPAERDVPMHTAMVQRADDGKAQETYGDVLSSDTPQHMNSTQALVQGTPSN